MNKKPIRTLLSKLLKTGIINESEYKQFNSVLKSLKTEEAIELLESEIADTALTKGRLDKEIHYLTRMITATKSTEFTEEDLILALRRESKEDSPLQVIKLESIDLYEFQDDYYRTGYHAVIGIEIDDKKYSFGYNRQTRSLSYTENNGPIRWFNFPRSRKEEFNHDAIVEITLKQILDI